MASDCKEGGGLDNVDSSMHTLLDGLETNGVHARRLAKCTLYGRAYFAGMRT